MAPFLNSSEPKFVTPFELVWMERQREVRFALPFLGSRAKRKTNLEIPLSMFELPGRKKRKNFSLLASIGKRVNFFLHFLALFERESVRLLAPQSLSARGGGNTVPRCLLLPLLGLLRFSPFPSWCFWSSSPRRRLKLGGAQGAFGSERCIIKRSCSLAEWKLYHRVWHLRSFLVPVHTLRHFHNIVFHTYGGSLELDFCSLAYVLSRTFRHSIF